VGKQRWHVALGTTGVGLAEQTEQAGWLPPVDEWVEMALSGYTRRPRKARQIMIALHRVLSDAGQAEVAVPVRAIALAAAASPSSVASTIERLRRSGLLRLTGGGEWVALPGGRPGQRTPYRYRAQWPPPSAGDGRRDPPPTPPGRLEDGPIAPPPG
jgi:hypothetical protein